MPRHRPRERHVNAYAKSIKVAKDCNFFPLILQVYSTKQLEEIYKRTSCTKILKMKLTVDGGMAVQIPQLFAELRRRTRCYPVHTSRNTPIDTYSHFNVELLLITISFFHLFIFARLFQLVVLAPSHLFTKSQR